MTRGFNVATMRLLPTPSPPGEPWFVIRCVPISPGPTPSWTMTRTTSRVGSGRTGWSESRAASTTESSSRPARAVRTLAACRATRCTTRHPTTSCDPSIPMRPAAHATPANCRPTTPITYRTLPGAGASTATCRTRPTALLKAIRSHRDQQSQRWRGRGGGTAQRMQPVSSRPDRWVGRREALTQLVRPAGLRSVEPRGETTDLDAPAAMRTGCLPGDAGQRALAAWHLPAGDLRQTHLGEEAVALLAELLGRSRTPRSAGWLFVRCVRQPGLSELSVDPESS